MTTSTFHSPLVVEDIAEKWGGGVTTSTFHSSLVVEDIAEKWGGGVTKVALLKARPFDMKMRDGSNERCTEEAKGDIASPLNVELLDVIMATCLLQFQ